LTPSLLSDLRAALLAKRAELRPPTREDLALVKHADMLDQVQADMTREQAEAAANRVDRSLREIDAALARVKDGSYGLCDSCEESISERRLRAIPEARFCISCASEKERRG
jgi:DnaK suppressor protein